MATQPARAATGFSKLVGIDAFTLGPDGAVRAVLDVGPAHHNEGGIVHGGALATLLDSVMGGAVVQTLRDVEWTATETLTLQFLRPAAGRLEAEGRVDRRGRLTAFVSAECRGADGDVVARATGVWAIRKG